MSVSDPIADMLTRIRNAGMARHQSVLIPASRMKLAIVRIPYYTLRNGERTMSRIGKLPAPLPQGVTVRFSEDNEVTVKGPKGTLTQQLPQQMILRQEDGPVYVERPDDTGPSRALHGLTR